MRRAAVWIVVVLCAGGWEALRAPDPDVDKGNQAFKEGRHGEALGHYRAAEERGADPRLHFDMGAALYKLGEKEKDEAERGKLFGQAEEQFRRAAEAEEAGLKSSAYFNLGNTMYQRQQWEDAISAYKRALRSDPKNEAARHNLEMALRQRKKQDPEQQQDQQGQGQKGQGQKDQQQGQQGQQRQDDPEQGQQGSQGQEQDREQQQQGQQGGQAPPDAPDPEGGQERLPDRPPPRQPPQDRKPDGPGQDPQAREQEEESGAKSDSPSDQDRKLDELERRSRDLRKRLLRQGGPNRDPMRLPSRKDW